MKHRYFVAQALSLVLTVAGLSSRAVAAEANANPTSQPNKADGKSLTVAILDFDATSPGSPELGKQIGEALTAVLSGEDGITLVDRASLARTLQENSLNLTGLVNADQATKIGKLVGARILVTGKVFPLDKQLFFTAKLIGTETSLVEGVLVKGDKDANIGDLMMQVAEKVAQKLRTKGPQLVARDDAFEDPLPGLKKAMEGRELPAISVRIEERHVTEAAPARIDPAAETEVRMILKDAGFRVIDGTAADLADAKVQYVISGEAFSEFADRIATLMNCTARVEIKVADRKTGEIVYIDRQTTRAVDLAENIAGKTALQKAGRLLAIRILQHFDKILPKAKARAEGGQEKKAE